VLTPGTLMAAAVDKAHELVEQIDGALMLQQFDNPANPEIHRRTTAEEIWNDTRGEVDVFVAGVGTGGTITGVGEVLKARKPSVHIVAVEPSLAAVLSGKKPGHHFMPGLGAGFVPRVLNRDVIDRVMAIDDARAVSMQLALARQEGISAGISSGAALAAALELAASRDMKGKTFVVVLPDGGDRYVQSASFQELRAKVDR
jgi:cysteine synthase